MKLFFTAWLMINGAWTHGSISDGWWPLAYQTEEGCQAALAYVERNPTSGVTFTCETLEDTMVYIKDLQR